MSAKQLLDGPALLQKIRRIAFQIYENNFEEKEIIIAGVVGKVLPWLNSFVNTYARSQKCLLKP